MKTTKILSLLFVSSTLLFSCNNSEKVSPKIEESPKNKLAVIESVDSNEIESEHYLYVTAYSGLSLREYNNLKSKKLAVMPYGARVKVISSEIKNTMTIDEIEGGMDQIEYNHKKGFAFNGYLSKVFPPEKGISPKGYAEELKVLYPDVLFSETSGGTVSKPTNTETFILPINNWQDAFFIAQQLYKFPKQFKLPSPKGKENEIIKDKMPNKKSWISELHISRQENKLVKIEYVYKNKGFSSFVTITKEGIGMKISKTEVVE